MAAGCVVLGELYTAVARELQTPPVDLRTARRRLRRYVRAVNRRIDGEEGEDRDEG